jgi:hypothetical protein
MRRSDVRLVAFGVLVGALGTETPALAQVSAPTSQLSSTSLGGGASSPGDVSSLSGFVLSAPMHLALEGSIFPVGGAYPNCAPLEEDSGNSVGGIPVHHYAEFRLTPKLVLSGFSQLGCPIDAGLGGAVTYATPIRESTWLVFGAGIYGVPGQLPLFGGMQTSPLRRLQGTSSPVRTTGRVDIVWQAKDGNPYNIGVQSLGRGGSNSSSEAASSGRP